MKHWCPFVPKDLTGDAAAAGTPETRGSPTQGSKLETAELSHILQTRFARQMFIGHPGRARLRARQWRGCKG